MVAEELTVYSFNAWRYGRTDTAPGTGTGPFKAGTYQMVIVSSTHLYGPRQTGLTEGGFILHSEASSTREKVYSRLLKSDSVDVTFTVSLNGTSSDPLACWILSIPYPFNVAAGESVNSSVTKFSRVTVPPWGRVYGLAWTYINRGGATLGDTSYETLLDGTSYAGYAKTLNNYNPLDVTVPDARWGSYYNGYTHSVAIGMEFSPGIQFQIKHNGSLIPATPHLWSGGSLTPVNLNLPQ